MSDGALRIPITGDASQFKKTLAQLEADLKGFKEKLKTAKGDQIVKFNVDIQGTKQAINDLTTFGKFAEGTLGRLYQQLEQLKTLRLSIQADATALTPVNNAIDETTKKIKDLLSAGLQKPIVEAAQVSANSIQGLKNRIDELNQKKLNLDAKDDYLQIVKLNQEIDRLKTQINNLNKLGLKVDQTIDPAVNSFRNLTNTSNKSRQALTSLSLVAQDLPFGFIAIQNNLPAVIQTFGQLKAESGTTKGALSALAEGLVGPAGLFLAFSVVTGAVTFAIQKYGSLSGAVEALFGRYTDLGDVVRRAKDEIDKFNKSLLTNNELVSKSFASVQGNITKAEALGKVVLDLSKSENERKLALQNLQKLDKNRFKSFDVEKNKLEGLREAINGYTQGQISASKADTFANQLNKQSDIVETNRNALFSLQQQIDELIKKYPNITSEVKDYEKAQLAATKTFGVRPFTSIPESDILRFQQLTTESQKFSKQLIDSNNELEKLRTTTSIFVTEASAADVFEETGRKASSATKKVKEYKEELSKVVPLFDMFQIKEKKTKQGLFFDFLEGLFSKNDLNQLKEAYKRLQDTQKELDKFREENAQPNLPTEAPRVRESNELIKNKERLAQIVDQYKKTKSAVEEVFFNPLTDLFQNFFETGKLGFKQFADDALKQLQRILVSQITNKLISLLASALVPGSGFIVKAGLKTIETGALGDFLSNATGSANFGGVVGAGMNMSGQVNVVLRGSDLIGAINRTNSTINRIG